MFVQVDDGKQFAVVIPEGLSPGDEFEVEEPDWSAGEHQEAVASPQNIPAATSASEDDVAGVPTAAMGDRSEDNASVDELTDKPPPVSSEESVGDGGEMLPDGWEVAVSRSTGQRYYVNTLT